MVKILGILFIAFGIVDFIGGFINFDVWAKLGVRLPDIIWEYSAFAEVLIGVMLLRLGAGGGVEAEVAETAGIDDSIE